MTIKKITTGKYKGKWQVRIQPMNSITKKRINVSPQYTSTKREAIKLEHKMWNEYNSGFDFEISKHKFTEEFDRYVNKQIKDGYWSDNTVKAWNYSNRIFKQYFKDVKMADMNQNLVREFSRKFVVEHKASASKDSVIAKCLTHMRRFFKPLVGKCFNENPVPERPLQQFFRTDELVSQHQYHLLNDSEYSALKEVILNSLNICNPTKSVSKLAVWIGLETGMRPQEIQALKWDNLVLDDANPYFIINDSWNGTAGKLNGHLKSRKMGEFRQTLPISKNLVETLSKFKDIQQTYLQSKQIENKCNFILLNLNNYQKASSGIPVNQHRMNDMLHKLGKLANIKVLPNEKWSMYSLRHSAATKLGNTPNMSYPWAASRLGHTLAQFMKTYVHVDKDIDLNMENKWLVQQ